MKQKIYFLTLLLCMAGVGQMSAQSKSSARDAKKAIEKAQGDSLFNVVSQAINDHAFVVEADKVQFKRGNPVFVTPTTNFVMLNDEKATVQLASNSAWPGFNNMGGITVEGNATDVKISTDKRGNIRLKMGVMGTGVSATVEIVVYPGGNQASATVYPNFSGNNIYFTGTVYPIEESNSFKGRVL